MGEAPTLRERFASFFGAAEAEAEAGPSAPPSVRQPATDADRQAAWKAFVDASEIEATLAAYSKLREAYAVPSKLTGLEAFAALVSPETEPTMPARVRETMRVLTKQRDRRSQGDGKRPPLLVVVSGAGPNGLRCAVECALHGMTVTVVEKRTTFSRVNILTLWSQTADDLVGFGASIRLSSAMA